jgi:hypothetical protein
MKKLLFVSSFLLVLVIASPVMASTVTVNWASGHYTYPGGEFTLTGDVGDYLPYYNGAAVVGGGIQSFCLEKNEYVSIGKTYNFTENIAAVNGGVGGPHPDPLSAGAAYLYYQFSQGKLTGYDYTLDGRAASAAALQNAIWYLEEEGGALSDLLTHVLKAEFGDSSTLADWRADNTGRYPVMVLNLTSKNSAGAIIYNQDQLATVGHVPIPPTVYLLGGGLLGLVGLRRKFKG